jgi:hypothetical protein
VVRGEDAGDFCAETGGACGYEDDLWSVGCHGVVCLDHAMVVGAWRGVWRYVGRGDGAWFRLQSNSELRDLWLGNRKETLDV